MKTNDLKKGAKVKMANGWLAEIYDNTKGNTRLAMVDGFERELGSVYSHDINAYYDSTSDSWLPIEHTKAQLKLKSVVEARGN